MKEYTKSQFATQNQEEIQEMYQFLWGEWYLYLDSLITSDEKEAKVWSEQIFSFVEVFFEMLSQWLKQVPTLLEYYPYMKKYPYLYLVWPEAAILNLHKSFITSLELIFGASPRSDDFMKTSSNILKRSSSFSQPKSKKFHLVSN